MRSYTFSTPIFHRVCQQCGTLATGWACVETRFYHLPCGCASNESFRQPPLAPELVALAILRADDGNIVTADIYGMSMVRIHGGNT